MIYHVLPGDAQVEEFHKTGLDGEVIVFREALISGPLEASDLNEFWEQRARFILTEYGEDEIDYQEKVASEISRLVEVAEDDEVNLWFEYELFCSVNMWFGLSLLADSGATIYRVEPIGLDEVTRWDGFAHFTADDLRASHQLRSQFTPDDISLGADLWKAYSTGDEASLRDLAAYQSPCFPYLREVVAAALEQDIEPVEVVRAISRNGIVEFDKIFAEFKKRAGVYGYGDVQVRRLLDQL